MRKFFWIILIWLLTSGQINTSLISVGVLNKTRGLSVGSDDILQSVNLTSDGVREDEMKMTTDDFDYENSVEARETVEEGTTEVTVETTTDESTTKSSTIETSEITSSITDPTTTSLPNTCSYHLTSDTEILFPTTELPFDKQHNISWCFELSSGPAVNIHVDYLNLNPQSDYLIIVAGNGDEENEKGKWITGTQTNITFKIIHTNRAFIFLSYQAKTEAGNWGFKIDVTSYGEHPSSTIPPSTTAPPYVGNAQTITKSLTVAQELHNHTDLWDITLRNALVEATNLWRDTHNYSEYLQKCKRENVYIERVSPCPKSWPDNLNCVRLEFAIPLNETDYDGELDEGLSPAYELTKEHLEQIWQEFGIMKLEEQGIAEYFLPNATTVLLTWVSVSLAIVIIFCIVLWLIWKNDLFKDYSRMNEEPENEKSSNEDQKQIDISEIPTPFLDGEDELPAEFGEDFEFESSIHDQDTTIYDVRTPPPLKSSVKFARHVENIEDEEGAGAYTNPFVLEIEASEKFKMRESEC